MRSGHTEAAVDLCRLANLEPVGVICELVNDDGTVMRGPQIKLFAEKHKLKHISVADMIAYRQAREKLVERVGEFHGRDRYRDAQGLRLRDAVRQGAAHGVGARARRRRLRHADAAAPRQHHFGRVRRREERERRAPALQEGRTRRHRDSARRHRRRADAGAAAGRRVGGRSRAHAVSGARSGSARRSCGTSACARSGCCRRASTPMLASAASASRSPRRRGWRGNITPARVLPRAVPPPPPAPVRWQVRPAAARARSC